MENVKKENYETTIEMTIEDGIIKRKTIHKQEGIKYFETEPISYFLIFNEKDLDEFGRPKRGTKVLKKGYAGIGKLVHIDNESVVISWKGYAENPGSRYSGLKEYYPATTEVLLKKDRNKNFNESRYYSLTEWNSRERKGK